MEVIDATLLVAQKHHVLAREVAEEGPGGDVGSVGYLLHRHSVEAVSGKQRERGPLDPVRHECRSPLAQLVTRVRIRPPSHICHDMTECHILSMGGPYNVWRRLLVIGGWTSHGSGPAAQRLPRSSHDVARGDDSDDGEAGRKAGCGIADG